MIEFRPERVDIGHATEFFGELWTEPVEPIIEVDLSAAVGLEDETIYSLESFGERDITGQAIDSLLVGMDKRDQKVLDLSYGLTGRVCRIDEIAVQIQRSPRQTRRIRDRALFIFRNPGETPPTLH